MTDTTILIETLQSGIRLELHSSPKSAKHSQARWLAMGFQTKIYFVDENSDSLLCGLEVSI